MSRGKRNPDTPFLSRTEVTAEKTAGEIQEILGRNKLVKRVMAAYEASEIMGVSFTIMIQDREVLFRLPVRLASIREGFRRSRKTQAAPRFQTG
jgi:hypothetical protein